MQSSTTLALNGRSGDPVDPVEPPGLDDPDPRAFAQYVFANGVVTSVCAVGLIVIYFTVVSSGWILVDAAIVGAATGAFAAAARLNSQRRERAALAVVAGANWVAAATTTAITPFVLPLVTPVLLMPVLVMVPYLRQRRELAIAIGMAIATAFVVTAAALGEWIRGPEDDAPAWLLDVILLGLVPVVVGLLALLAWQNHLRLAAHNDELRRSRARVVAATDQERRRIERDLHDGVQQQLVAIAIRLGVLGRLARDDPARAAALADELGFEVHDTIRCLRELAHGIYPALLADRGLADALSAVAAKAPLPVHVDAVGAGRYPTPVEEALYFCCLEALHNATKHAGATSIRMTVTEAIDSVGALACDVTDDGAGFDPGGVSAGRGLTNMSDRIAAVGGTVRVSSRPGDGTSVSIVVPSG